MLIKIKQGEFKLINADKVTRVIEGATDHRGRPTKGLGNDAKPEAIITQYDKLAGLIRGKEGSNVKLGCFWNFEERKPQEKPVVVYVFRINGRKVEVVDGEELPMEVKAAVQQNIEDIKDSKKRKTEVKKTK